MAIALDLKDGSREVIFSREGFKNLIYEKLGYDAENYVQEMIDEADYTQAKVGTDLDSYEGSLESDMYCFQEISDEIEEMKEILNMKRINKDKIWKTINRIEDLISNQI